MVSVTPGITLWDETKGGKAMKFEKVTAYGSAGGTNRMGHVTLNVTAKDCDTVESIRLLTEAAPDLLAALQAMLNHEGERVYSGIGTEHDSDALEAAKAQARAAVAKATG